MFSKFNSLQEGNGLHKDGEPMLCYELHNLVDMHDFFF